MKSTNIESQWRATFEDTKNKQEQLRNKFDILIRENRPLKPEEREQMFELLADSTFGIGTKEFVFWLSNGKKIFIPNFEEFVRCLYYYEKSIVDGIFFSKVLGKYSDYSIEISNLWECIRNKCFGINAEALAMSVRISKEREQRDFSTDGGFTFGTKKES